VKTILLLQRAERIFGGACLALMFGIICLNVVMRYIFSEPFYWSEEASNYLFVWIGFLSCAHAVSDDAHIRVTAFVGLLPAKTQHLIALALDILMIVVFGSFVLPSIGALGSLHISTGLQIHEAYPYSIIPLTMVLCCVHLAFKFAGDLALLVRPARS
jgi:TRAP-type C4-dicarboxylate transport system permease small subunit